MNSRGFTLMELAVVVMITGIVLIAVIPGFRRFRSSLQSNQAGEQLMRDIRTARQRAVTGRTPVIIAFGNGTTTTNVTTYTIHTDTNGDRIYQASELKTTRTFPGTAKLATVALTPTDSITFDISGVLWPGTSGGSLRLVTGALSVTVRDTIDVSATGMVYRR